MAYEARLIAYLDHTVVIPICTRMCEAMANVHKKGVLQLDLKLGNVMLEPLGQVVIIDIRAGPARGRVARRRRCSGREVAPG